MACAYYRAFFNGTVFSASVANFDGFRPRDYRESIDSLKTFSATIGIRKYIASDLKRLTRSGEYNFNHSQARIKVPFSARIIIKVTPWLQKSS